MDRLAYRLVKQARGTPVIADERVLRARWAEAAAKAGLAFTAAFGKNEWEQVILAQDLRTEQAYLTCPRTGRGRPLTKAQRSQVWQAAQQVTTELTEARESTHLQLATRPRRAAPPEDCGGIWAFNEYQVELDDTFNADEVTERLVGLAEIPPAGLASLPGQLDQPIPFGTGDARLMLDWSPTSQFLT